MTDPRDAKLTAAIEQALQEYNADAEIPTYVTNWVLVTAEIDPANDNRSGIGIAYPNGNMQWPTALGIIEAAKLRLAAQWQADQDG